MGKKLRDLIRSVRAAKSAQEEREVIAKECALIRTEFKETNKGHLRHRNIAKLMYVDMLGYPTHFGQMEVIKLIGGGNFSEKRVGYLALMVLLDENAEVLMLVTQCLQRDMQHDNPYIVGLALCSLGNIASDDMARDLAPDVEKLLRNGNPYIRKKAALCAVRLVKKAPDLHEDFSHSAAQMMSDKNHGALLGGVTLCYHLIESVSENASRKGSAKLIKLFRKQMPTLISNLKQLVLSSYDPDYDVSGVTDPFLQVKILKLLRVLSVGHQKSSDDINDILTQVATNTESTKNPGNAILYETVQTIMSIEAESGLRVLAINILGRFLMNRDNNIRYVALNTLCKCGQTDTSALQRHRNTIVDCLKDNDISIRKRALDLIYTLVNPNNVRALIRELLNYLVLSTSGESDFKADLTNKICTIVERFAPDKLWHIDTIIKVLTAAGNLANQRIGSNLVNVVQNQPDFHAYTAHKLFRSVQHNLDQSELVRVAVWCIGEYGEHLVSDSGAKDACLDDKDNFTKVSEKEILDVLVKTMEHHDTTAKLRGYVLTSLVKLSTRFTETNNRIRKMIGTYKKSMTLELQARSVEFLSLTQDSMAGIRGEIVGQMPAVEMDSDAFQNGDNDDESGSESESESDSESESSDEEPAAPQKKKPSRRKQQQQQNPKPKSEPKTSEPDSLFPDLLDTTSIAPTNGTANNNNNKPDSFDPLAGLFDNPPASANNTSPTTNNTATNNNNNRNNNNSSGDLLADIFGGASNPTPSPQQAQPQPSPQPSPTQPAPQSGSSSSMVAFEEGGLRILFAFKKESPGVTRIRALFENTSGSELQACELKIALPKYLRLELQPASGSVVAAHSKQSGPTQQMRITNSQHGQKPLLMRIMLSWRTAQGQQVQHKAQISSFPPGI